jgi:hypothetical protein
LQVLSRKIDSELRVNAALEYLMQKPDANVDVAAFETACGVGVVVTPGANVINVFLSVIYRFS